MKIEVRYEAGPSRSLCANGKIVGVDYMLAVVPDEDGGYELYAEMKNNTFDEALGGCTDEYATYDDLKAMILEQACAVGIPEDWLIFPM